MACTSVTLKQLRYFVHVVEAGSISRAAERLHVAQTAVGLQIRALEDSLFSTLLCRHHKGISTTRAGRRVYERAREILQSVEQLADEVAGAPGSIRREVSLGLPPTVMRAIGSRAIVTEHDRLPDTHLHLVEAGREHLVEGLEAGAYDYIFTHDIGSTGTLRAIPVLRQPLVLVTRAGEGPPPGPVRFADAVRTEMVSRGETSHALDLVNRTAAEFGLRSNIVYEIDSLTAMKQLIQECGATSILPADLVIDEIARGEFEVHQIVEPALEMTLEFLMRSADLPTREDRPLFAFLDDLLDRFLDEIGAADRRLGRLTAIPVPATTGDRQAG